MSHVGDTTVSAVTCDSYDSGQVERAVSSAIAFAGGLPKQFAPGKRILIKPNLLTAKTPENAATTHPEVVRALIRYLKREGITDLTVGDSPAGPFSWQELWEKTGFLALAEEEGISLLPFENINRKQCLQVGFIPLLRELSEFDAVISVPKLKTHMLTKITGAVKNSYGLIIGNAKSGYHGAFPSPGKMGRFIADFYDLVKPDFVVMDAVTCMEGDGPSSGKPQDLGLVFAGADAVAVDTCACRAYGYTENDIPFLVKAKENQAGVADFSLLDRTGDGWQRLEQATLKRSKSDLLHRFPEMLFKLGTTLISCKPQIVQAACRKCGKCAEVCSQGAIGRNNAGQYRIRKRACIVCICCVEACPYHAIEMVSPGIRLHNFLKSCLGKGGKRDNQ